MIRLGIETIAKIRAVMVVALLIYAAYLSAGLFWHLLGSSEEAALVLPQSKIASVKKNQTRNGRLADYHLFGQAGKQVVKKQDKPKEAPKTNLRLALKGVFMSEQAGASGAIVEEIGKKADYYGIGDSLPGNAVLEEVYSDRILLRRNGRLETLAFEEKKSSKSSNSIAKVEAKPKAKPKSKTKAKRVETPQQFMDEATERLREDPVAALGSVGLKASNDGYVYQGGNPMLSGLNMKKGDVIRSVNGHSLGDIQQDKELMKSLYEQGSLEVEVMRDGASFYINYPLR